MSASEAGAPQWAPASRHYTIMDSQNTAATAASIPATATPSQWRLATIFGVCGALAAVLVVVFDTLGAFSALLWLWSQFTPEFERVAVDPLVGF